ncbi:unnamed protein product, partial [Ectocarpus sp. 13 AM-2016]
SLDVQVDSVSLLVGHLRRFVSLPPPVDGGLEGTGPRSGGSGGGGSGGGGGAPLLLGRCLNSAGEIVEPLPLLLGCLHSMLVAGRESLAEHARSSNSSPRRGGGAVDPENMLDNDDGDGPLGPAEAAAAAASGGLRETLNELEGDLRRLSTALSGCPLSEFDLDKVADFSPSGGLAARTKLATAALLCGSYEALMQGSLLLPATVGGQRSTAAAAVSPVHGYSKLPALASVQGVLRLFDCRQALLDLVRPSLPTAAQQRAKKGSGGAASNSNSSSNGLWGESESSSGGGGGQPGFSAAGCFGLTLYPGGMPCLGLAFVEDMLAVLNVDASSGEETEGDTERDPGQMDVHLSRDDPPTEAVREDLRLQRLALETCRGHLRCLRAGAAQPSSGGGGGLAVDLGGGPSAKGVAGGVHGGGPRDEADAGRAGKAAVKRCAVLAPLLLREFFRQVTTGNTSGAAWDAAAAAKASKGKGKSGGGDTGTKKKTSSAPSESLAELALSCFEECVCIAAHCSPQKGTAASRTAKMLAAAYDSFPNSSVAPADSAGVRGGSGGRGGAAVAAGVLGRHAEGLVNTFVSLVGDDQMKEAETVCRILSQLTRLLRLHPKSLETHGASLKRVCEQQNIKCPGLAKAVVSLYLEAHMSMKAKGGRIAALHDVARQVSACLGPREEDEEEDDEPPVVTFQVINNFTMNAINDVTVGTVQACIGDVEYALRLLQKAALARQARVSAQTPEGMRSLLSRGGGRGGAGESQSSGTVSEASDDDDLNSDDGSCADFGRNSDSDEDAAGIRSDGGVGERDPLDRRETLVCDRLRVVMNALTVLLASKMPGRSVEKLVSSATRVFRTMTKVLKVRLSLKKAYIGAGLKHVLATKQGFTKALQELLPNLNGEDETTKNNMTKNNVTAKNSITRQSRLVPALIFQIEECDVQLLLLGKLCKGSLDLPKWVTSRVDRDFRIDQKVVAECQEEVRASRQKRKRGATGKKKKDTGKSSAKKKKDAKHNKASLESKRRQGDDEEDGDQEEEEEEEEGEGCDEGDQEEEQDDDEEEGSGDDE